MEYDEGQSGGIDQLHGNGDHTPSQDCANVTDRRQPWTGPCRTFAMRNKEYSYCAIHLSSDILDKGQACIRSLKLLKRYSYGVVIHIVHILLGILQAHGQRVHVLLGLLPWPTCSHTARYTPSSPLPTRSCTARYTPSATWPTRAVRNCVGQGAEGVDRAGRKPVAKGAERVDQAVRKQKNHILMRRRIQIGVIYLCRWPRGCKHP